MKKICAFILVMLMCISLCACAGKTREVEITMENWSEYFELTYGYEWCMDDFGDTNRLNIYSCFCVREEYADKLKLDKSELTVEVYEYWTLGSFDFDLENRTVSEIKYFEPASEGILIGERNKYITFNLENASTANADNMILQDSNGTLVHCIFNNRVPDDMYDGVDEQQGYSMHEYSVSRIQGKIVIKE